NREIDFDESFGFSIRRTEVPSGHSDGPSQLGLLCRPHLAHSPFEESQAVSVRRFLLGHRRNRLIVRIQPGLYHFDVRESPGRFSSVIQKTGSAAQTRRSRALVEWQRRRLLPLVDSGRTRKAPFSLCPTHGRYQSVSRGDGRIEMGQEVAAELGSSRTVAPAESSPPQQQ